VLALPKSVWESWQRHLGRPELTATKKGFYRLVSPKQGPTGVFKSWIIVFDIDPHPNDGPSNLILDKVIATSAEALSYYAFEIAPSTAVAVDGPIMSIDSQIRRRLGQYWPEVGGGVVGRRRTSKRRPTNL
jgi:hypothetical protein